MWPLGSRFTLAHDLRLVRAVASLAVVYADIGMSVYMTNPDALPDSGFQPGGFHHLVLGNTGRLLDPRRTPVTITAIRSETATFVVRIDDFEDRGALWEIPFEDVTQYQFSRSTVRADPANVREFQNRAHALNRRLAITCDPQVRAATQERRNQPQSSACS